MTINPSSDAFEPARLNHRISGMSSHSISPQDSQLAAARSSTDSCGEDSDRDSKPSLIHREKNDQLMNHDEMEQAEEEDFSENSEDLFATPFNPIVADSRTGFFDSGSDDLKNDEDESWTSYNDYNDEDYQSNNSWMMDSTSSSSDGDDDGSDDNKISSLSRAKRKMAKGPLVWVLREGIGGMEQAARLVLPHNSHNDSSSFAQDDEVEIQWTNDGSFEWVSREDVRLALKDSTHSRSTLSSSSSSSSMSTSSSSASLPPPSREQRMQSFHNSELSTSGRRIMRMGNNIITSDVESSESSISSDGSVELPTLGSKLGNMMGFPKRNNSSSSNHPKRFSSSSTSVKQAQDTTLAGATPARKRSLPTFPLGSPLRRSNSLGKRRSSRSPPPPTTLGDTIENNNGNGDDTTTNHELDRDAHDSKGKSNEEELLSSSFHHQQRRARKGAKKQAFQSKSADSMPNNIKLQESPMIFVQTKSFLSNNSAHSAPQNVAKSAAQHEANEEQDELKSSSFHHHQRKARKGAKKKAFKSRSADSQPAELMESPTITEVKSLWQELYASSPEFKTTTATAVPNNTTTSTTTTTTTVDKEGKEEETDSTIIQPSSFHHDQRKQRKGGIIKKAFKSRSADSQPVEFMESSVIRSSSDKAKNSSSNSSNNNQNNKALSKSMHNLVKPESMKMSSHHHEQRKARRNSKTKQTKSRSADSMPVEMTESPFMALSASLSASMHTPGEQPVPRRKRSLSSKGLVSPAGLMKRSFKLSPKQTTTTISPNSAPLSSSGIIKRGNLLSECLPLAADFMTPEQVPKKKSAIARKTDSEMIMMVGSPNNPRRNASLRNSEADAILSPSNSNNLRRANSIQRSNNNVADLIVSPKQRNSSLKRNSSDHHASPKQRNSSLKQNRSDHHVGAKYRNSSSSKSPKKEDASGLAYLQNKKQQQQEAPFRRSGVSVLTSPKNEPRRVANVDSAISSSSSLLMIKGNRSVRKLDGLGADSGHNRKRMNVDSAIQLMKKQNSQRQLMDVAKESTNGRTSASNADDLALDAVLNNSNNKKTKSPRKSAASRLLLLGRNNHFDLKEVHDLPSPPINDRKYQSTSSILNHKEGEQDLNDSFVTRAYKLDVSPNQAKRANVKSKFEALNDRMSVTIGVEASPDNRFREKKSTLREKREAKRQSVTKLTNAFHRMIQPDSTEKTTSNDSNDLEVPVNN